MTFQEFFHGVGGLFCENLLAHHLLIVGYGLIIEHGAVIDGGIHVQFLTGIHQVESDLLPVGVIILQSLMQPV